jgi:(1->4)-alpha-D-glucan 1-alpha-D-glucosylmutase
VRRLAERLLKLAGPDRPLAGVPLAGLARAISEMIVALPVYRTYVDERRPVPLGEDRRLIELALAGARERGRAPAAALDLLQSALLPAEGAPADATLEQFRLRFVQRFQQLSGPATAKGVEDTAFYVYTPLLSRNEVGGGPETPLAHAVAAFHAGNSYRASRFPTAMLAVTTHDTKRNADVRARLDLLSEIPAEWGERLDLWRKLNQPFKTPVRARRFPDPNTVQHLFQALVGLWPLGPFEAGELDSLRERLCAYMLKAAREAKQHTSWTEPDAEFEQALQADVEAVLSPDRAPRLLDDVERFVHRIARPGLWNALSRTVLQLASPGVPDIYQGDELWNLALVDPDNRRPVDYEERARKLGEIELGTEGTAEVRRGLLADMVRQMEDGRLKLHVIRAALTARRRRPELFRSTDYLPLRANGPKAEHVVAFGRGAGSSRLVAVIPRLIGAASPPDAFPAAAHWRGTVLTLPEDGPRRWACALSGELHSVADDGRLHLAELFRILPVALLLSEPAH